MPPNPLANAWLRHASHAASRHATCPASQKVAPPPLANPAYARGLLLRTRRIHTGRQLIVCSTLYMFMHYKMFLGAKND